MDDKQFGEITRAMSREMTRRGALARLGAGLLAAAGASRFSSRPAAAASVTPVVVAGNPTCQDLGYAFEFKKNDPPAGESTYDLTDCGGNVIGSVTIDRAANDLSFDWSSTIGIDAVISKGGNSANVYAYDPPAESFGDTNLTTPSECGPPVNPQPCGISHISFCYDLDLIVEKTAVTTFTRTWDWTIDKICPADILLSPGQTFNAEYEVTVNATSTDSAWAVSGEITIDNPSCDDATITDVSDTISGGINATVDCGVTFPHVLGSGETLDCTYSAALPNGDDRVNTATVTTTGEVGGGSDDADVDFGNPTTVTDECVNVTDTLGGDLGQVCEDDADKTLEYTHLVDADNFQCGANTLSNTATFTTNDTGTTGDDSCDVTVTVACEGGCTLTQGYWKTHSKSGPAPYDDTWALLGPAEENTTFFLSGQTYYQVLWTAPAGNPYYTLAHQYIAVQLNALNGATLPAAVQTAFDAATALFTTKTPAQAGDKKNKALQTQFKALVGTLDAFNNGVTGPGHCSEDTTSNASFKQDAPAGGKKDKKKKGKKSGKKGKKSKKGGNGKKAGKENSKRDSKRGKKGNGKSRGKGKR